MVNTFSLPQHAWYDPKEVPFSLPGSWNVRIYNIAGYDRLPLRQEEIRAAVVTSPVGMPPIRETARGKKEVVIIFDDMTRCTQASKIVPFVLDELVEAGIGDNQIRFIAAVGTHAPLDRISLAKKLGEDIIARFPVYNHCPFMNCTYLGRTSFGTKVSINAEVMSCDLKIGIGQITPHVITGFSGGGKIIMPGVSSYDTVEAHHGSTHKAWQKEHGPFGISRMGVVDGNPMNEEIREAAMMAGLDMKIDCIVNMSGDMVDVFAGALVPAYSAGIEVAKAHYAVPAIQDNDIVIANSFVKASEPLAAALNAYHAVTRKGGDVVLVASSPPGQAILYLLHSWGKTIGGSLYHRHQIPSHINRLILYTEYPEATLLDSFAEPEKVLILSRWDDVIASLTEFHGDHAKVAVYPGADIQYFI